MTHGAILAVSEITNQQLTPVQAHWAQRGSQANPNLTYKYPKVCSFLGSGIQASGPYLLSLSKTPPRTEYFDTLITVE